jgi:hypothetical protein
MRLLTFMRKRWLLMLASALTFAFLAASLVPGTRLRAEDDGDDGDESRIRQGLAISPLELDLHGRNRALVGLGSYYVNAVSECVDCHTKIPQYVPGGNPFLGQPEQINLDNYLRGGRPFPAPDPTGVENPIVSRPLRPENGLPAGLTLEQFVDVLRNGTDYDHPGRLLQVMPWPTFQNMTDRDLRAIYEYLSALPP